jgi:addiction module HigA family antidote
MSERVLDPIHPGEILLEEFMTPLDLSANALARRLAVPVTRVTELVRGRRGVTADTALRLAKFFGTSPDLWMGLQVEYDLRMSRRKAGKEIDARVGVLSEAVAPYRVRRGRAASRKK